MNYRRLQAWVMRLVGLVEILAFAAVVMPSSWMESRYAWLGTGAMPKGPVFDAVMRQVSWTYGLHGIGMWIIASDVVRYRPLVWLTAFGYLLTGPVFIAIDYLEGMPWFWIAGNGGSCLLIGVIMLGLLWREKAGSTRTSTKVVPA
jgi:hypothetical protein